MKCCKKDYLVILLVLILSIIFVSNASADWTTDLTSPTCTITFNPPPPRIIGSVVAVTALADDSATGGSAIATASPYDFTFSVSPTTPALGAPTSTTTTTTSLTKIYSWTASAAGTYNFALNAYDMAGNQCAPINGVTNPSPPPIYITPVVVPFDISNAPPPFLKTTGGDVHANQ